MNWIQRIFRRGSDPATDSAKSKYCRKCDYVVLGVIQAWQGGALGEEPKPSFERVAAQCSRCPRASANWFRWVDGTSPDDPYWWGTPLGEPLGLKTGTLRETDPPPKVREPIEYEEVFDA